MWQIVIVDDLDPARATGASRGAARRPAPGLVAIRRRLPGVPAQLQDADGDGIGDLRGITARLDHLERLGVDVVWLSPIYRSPQRDNGYDISDYRAIDPVFGTLDDFDELLAEVHQRGMKLVMDLVVNHTSDEHPWFVESRSSPDNPKRDWYWWRPPRPGHDAGEPGAEPTNWSSFFGGPTWTLDEKTGEYYLHLFSPGQPDLNWENRDGPRRGLRADALVARSRRRRVPHGRHQHDLQGPGAARRRPPPGALLGDGFAHYANGPRLHEFLQEMHREVFAGRDGQLLTVGEMPGVTADEAALFTDPRGGELDMVFHFEHVSLDHDWSKFAPRPLDLRELKATLGRWQQVLGEVGWNSLYWSNHDQPRIVSRFGDDREHWSRSATMLATVLHLQRGTPYVYQGEELGMTNAPFADIEDFQDVETLGHYAVAVAAGRAPDRGARRDPAMGRDNARTPMQWDAGRRRRVHRGRAVAAGQPEPHVAQRRRPVRRPALGVQPLPQADRAASPRRGGRRRRLHDAARRRPARLRLHPSPR